MNEKLRWISISVLLVLLVISGTAFMSNGVAPTGFISLNAILNSVTGRVTGLPDCRASVNIGTPESVIIYPDTSADVEITISDVKCGVNTASLSLVNFPEDYYTVSPSFYPALFPRKTHVYKIHFNAPSSAEGMVYVVQAQVNGDAFKFTSNDFEVNVAKMPAKPGIAPPAKIEGVTNSESIGIIETFLSRSSWWGIGMVVVILLLSLVIYEYAPLKRRR